MKHLVKMFSSFAVLATLSGIVLADESSTSPVGYWKTIDDKTHKARSIVRITEVNGELRGKIVKLLDPPKDDPNPICKKCTGDNKNKPVLGVGFLWGFKREAKGWSDGSVLDPEEGKTYHGSIQVIDNGRRLKLFGYVRVIIKFGRGQVWERVQPPS